MKTTLEIPDELYRAVKSKAALEGKRVTDLVIQGMQLALGQALTVGGRVEFPIIKSKSRSTKMTLDDLKRAQDEMDQAEMQKIMKHSRR